MPDPAGPVVLIVRDGWGRNPNPQHETFNAVKLAHTDVCDRLLREFPWTLIHTSGRDVGLPDGTMGNSEVGHQNLGAGRIVDQESVRITKAIRSGAFFENDVLTRAMAPAPAPAPAVHLLGIASDAGVHGMLAHLYACLELCQRHGRRAAIHLFTDGRDTPPFSGAGFVEQVQDACERLGCGQIASVCGRYYAMDRDNRWQRVEQAYGVLTGRADAPAFQNAADAVRDYYEHPTNDSQRGDEFITPRYVGDWRATRIGDGHSVIFYNYRGDRPRQLTRAFVMPEFQDHVPPSPDTGQRGFDRGPRLHLCFVTMTSYEDALAPWVQAAFHKPPRFADIGGEYLARLGRRQFRCAETEKFAHVTSFFDDYREEPFPGETRQMAPSPKVSTYDLKPQMSADRVMQIVLDRLAAPDCEDFILVNFANADMVGHTGRLDAAIVAVQSVDVCVGRLVDAALRRGGRLLVTADHGNAEQMHDPDTGTPHTAHTTYEVECIVVDQGRRDNATGSADQPSPGLRRGGRLADVFPTVLELMALEKPDAMTGRSLLEACGEAL